MKNQNVGWLIERARYCIRERAFAEEWMRINKSYPSWRPDLLQQIFMRDTLPFIRERPRLVVTARERFIVASVIQWLGTNVGFSFLQDVLALIGLKIVPIDAERKQEYYHPFQKEQDASAWNNIVAENVRGSEVEKIQPYQRIRISKRKHLFRYLPDSQEKRCVRCGLKVSPYASSSEKECLPKGKMNFQKSENGVIARNSA